MTQFATVLLAAIIACSTLVASVSASRRDLPSCFSNTDAYIFKSLVVATQPLTSTLIQRYQGRQLTIMCMSFVEYGPSCGTSSVPQLCSRLVSDASASFTCETLSQYVTDPSAEVVRGSRDGPEMIWLVKWDGTSKAVSCYPRQVDIRMLAFIENGVESSKTVWAFLLILAILSVLLILVALFSYLRTRYYQIDASGATTIAGPKAVFRGPQMSVSAPTAQFKDITTVYLPVRDSAALNDMTTAKIGQLLSDPNTPRGRRDAIYLDEEFGPDGTQLSRGPGGSSIRRRKASPPAPGDGIHDPVLAQKMSEGRQMRSRLRRIGGGRRGGGGDDDDEIDDEDFFQSRNRGADGGDYDDFEDEFDGHPSSGGGRRRGMPGSANRRGGSQQRPRHGVLFPTQPNFTIGGDEGNDGLMRQQYGGNSTRGLDYNDDDFDPEKPEMRAPKGSVNASQHSIRYVPQWMQGSFGRGGVIPETGDGHESQGEGYDGGQPRSIHLDSYNGAPGTASKRFYEPVPDQENDPNSTQFRIGMRNSTPNGNKSQHPNGMDSGPRSALKRRGGNGGVGGGGNGFSGDADDLLRRGVSFDGDYVGQDRGGGGGGAGGRSFGGLGGGGQNGARQGGNNQQDNFSRNKAKIHNRAMQLDPSASQELGKGRGAVGGNDGSAMSNGGERMAVIGVDERGNPIYGPTRQSNGAQSVDANAAASYECEDCHERVHPGSHPVFCEATGLRHF